MPVRIMSTFSGNIPLSQLLSTEAYPSWSSVTSFSLVLYVPVYVLDRGIYCFWTWEDQTRRQSLGCMNKQAEHISIRTSSTLLTLLKRGCIFEV